jgi:hypothetical protein
MSGPCAHTSDLLTDDVFAVVCAAAGALVCAGPAIAGEIPSAAAAVRAASTVSGRHDIPRLIGTSIPSGIHCIVAALQRWNT